MERASVPRRYWQVAPDEVSPGTPQHRVLHRYLERVEEAVAHGYGVLLFGPNGVGKTGAAVCALMEARRRGYTVMFLEAAQMKRVVVQNVMFDGEYTVWERAHQVDLLVLDDVWKGTADGKGFGVDLIDELLRGRGAAMKATWMTSNLDPNQARHEKQVKASTLETMRETMLMVQAEGPNLRKSGQAAIRQALGVDDA